MSGFKKVVLISTIVLFICWSTITLVDFWCCTRSKTPVFAVPIEVTDCNKYRGLGYTITVRYEGPVGEADNKSKGYFSWGWY